MKSGRVAKQQSTHLNSYSVPSDPLEIRPQLTMDYLLDNPFDSSQRS